MFDQMKQVYEMQKKAKEIQRQLEAIKIEKRNSSGSLAVTVNGAQKIETLRVDAAWLTPDKKGALEASLVQLVNEAFQEVQRQSAAQAASLMQEFKGMNIPGL